jgi:hypothetical protein
MRYFSAGLLLAFAGMLQAAVTVEQFHVHDFSFKAQPAGNPFDVDLRGEFTGPGGVRLVVPGFYDGDNTWKIRFSPTAPGQWSLLTVSPVAALNNQSETAITATANSNKAIHGGLRIDPLHRNHFMFEDGSRYFLMGYEADWLWGTDMMDPQRKLMRHLIDQIDARGFNNVMVNVYAYDTSWAKGHTNQWDYGPPAMYVFGGTNEKPDYTRLNTDFFKIYDGMMQALLDKGIVANLMFKVYNKMVNWPAPGSVDEARYFRYVTSRYQAFPNVTWDFSKEAFNEPDKNLEKRLIDLIRATDGYHRLTTAHDNDVYDWNQNLNSNLDFRTDQEHNHWMEMALFDRSLRQWPYINSELYYERGVEDYPTYPVKQDWQDVVRGAYEVYLSGGYFVYYYSNTAWDLVKPDPEPPGMARFQILKASLSTLPYWRMQPKPELAVGGPCLAILGEIYAFYVKPPTPAGGGASRGGTGGAGAAGGPPAASPVGRGRGAGGPVGATGQGGRGGGGRGGEITVNLTALPGAATIQWINTWSGERTEDKLDQPGVYQLRRPASFADAPGLLVVRSNP